MKDTPDLLMDECLLPSAPARAAVPRDDIQRLKASYCRHLAFRRYCLLGMGLLCLLAALFAINVGSAATRPADIFKRLFQGGMDMSSTVLWSIRLPRVLAGLLAGAGLATAGCAMQTCLRNPLASPSTLGITNAAAFGANLAIALLGAGQMRSTASDAISIANPYLVTICALGASLIATGAILALGRLRRFTPESVVLAGVALGSLFIAGTALVQYFATDAQIAAMVFWTFGDLGRVAWREVGILAFIVLSCLGFLIRQAWSFNAMDSGADTASSLGVNVERTRLGAMLAASLITSVAVSFMGVIGFVGLIAPHAMRHLLGLDHRLLLPASALGGAFLLLCTDTLARTLIAPVVLPVGAVTAFFGAPLFLWILVKGFSVKEGCRR